MPDFIEFLQGLAATATGQGREIIERGARELPTEQDEQLALLVACQTELWRREGTGEVISNDAYSTLTRLRQQLLGN